jgi:hypothetical protein
MTAMKGWRGPRTLLVLAVLLAGTCAWAWTRSAGDVPARSAVGTSPTPTAVLRVDTSRLGDDFEPGAVGLSIETSELTTGRLSAAHNRLVRLMRLLGPAVLRIGANSVDFSWWTSSNEATPAWATNTIGPDDLRVLRGLLHATGWRVLLGVDFGHFEPARAADEARDARQILGAALLGIEIGNEPNEYSHAKGQGTVDLRPPTYDISDYLPEVEAYRQAVNEAAPGVAIYGPSLGKSQWFTQLGSIGQVFTDLVQHYYPTTTCGTASSSEPPPTAAGLLSSEVRNEESEFLQALAHASAAAGRPTRIGETNDISYCRESTPGSPSLASAVWALDWALRAASMGVTGLNFNGTLGACANDAQSQNQICAPSRRAADAGDFAPQPEYYGLLAASRLEGGQFVGTSVTDSVPLPNLTTWATVAPDGTIKVAIDNLATGGSPQRVSIPMPGSSATEVQLLGPSATATHGISLGGAQVTSSGRWRPRPFRLSHVRRALRIALPPASAAIISFHP